MKNIGVSNRFNTRSKPQVLDRLPIPASVNFLTAFCDRVQNLPELFNCVKFETPEIINSHQSGGFRTQELHKSYPHPFADLSRDILCLLF
jgi:hypothetical protein